MFKGTRMAGRMGGEQGHHPEPEVVQADAERGLLLVKGAVPGPKGGVVLIRNAVKAQVGADGHGRRQGRRRARRPARSSSTRPCFGIEPNVPVMHQVVTAQLAARRAGTQTTKTRAEVRGGGAKPWKQKGTGRARQGSIRSPHWVGGGVALGPKPRSYAQRTPKKMIRLALRSALSDRAADGKVARRRRWGFDAPETKAAVAALGAPRRRGPGARRAAAATTRPPGRASATSTDVHMLRAGELNAYDVLVSDWVVFTKDTLPVGPPGHPRPRPTEPDRRRRRPMKDPRDVILAPGREREVLRAPRRRRLHVPRRTRAPPSPRSTTPSRRSSACKVIKVNTLNRKGKRKRNRRTGTVGKPARHQAGPRHPRRGRAIDLFEG